MPSVIPCPHSGYCRVCPSGGSRYVAPNGPVPSRVLVIGEGPARTELRNGYPFCGPSGDELEEQYLPLAGLRRKQVRVDNAMCCAKHGFANPSNAEAAICAGLRLGAELRLVDPSVIVTLGAVAASLFGVNLEHDHGIPLWREFEHWAGWVLPAYHPAAGLHVGQFIGRIRSDFMALGELLQSLDRGEEPHLPRDEYPNPGYRLIECPEDLDCILNQGGGEAISTLGVDTESNTINGMAGAPPWCLTFSPAPGTGYLITADNHPTLAHFNKWLALQRPLAVLHHALHDIPVAAQMGVSFPRWTDSMQIAYILQDLPSMGLKSLARRQCGMAMRDFEDVVHPYARKVAGDYMVDVICSIESYWQYPHTLKSGPRKGQTEIRFKANMPPVARDTYNRAMALYRTLTRVQPPEDDAEDPDPWKRWDGWKPEVQADMIHIVGHPLPRPSITQVPFQLALAYACADADGTGRIYPKLRSLFRGREVRKEISR
jgi:uracil-DNA glycosylase family 4